MLKKQKEIVKLFYIEGLIKPLFFIKEVKIMLSGFFIMIGLLGLAKAIVYYVDKKYK